MPKKGGLGQFADLKGWLGKKEGGGVFERRGLIPQCTHESTERISNPYRQNPSIFSSEAL